MVNLEEDLVGFVVSPTFMLGIWHIDEGFGPRNPLTGNGGIHDKS